MATPVERQLVVSDVELVLINAETVVLEVFYGQVLLLLVERN
jgi:hypothetical protein